MPLGGRPRAEHAEDERIGRRTGLSCIPGATGDDAQRFFKKVEFEEVSEAAVRLHPAGATSPVVIDPLVSFGRPSVQGIATERLWELVDLTGQPR